jgi:sugar lactone lactonase YvrE
VDLGSGYVAVTPLDNAGTRALFTGNAVGVSSSRVLDDVGELTRRGIQVTLTNNTAEPIGVHGSFRVVLSHFANLSGLSTTYSLETQVSTPASPSRPYGVETDSDGNVYFSGKTTGQIHKMVNGVSAPLAAGFSGPAGVAVLPGTDYLVVAENAGNVISLTSMTSGGRTVIAGTGAAGSADGPGAAATFDKPDGVTVDSHGSIYVSDAGTSRIRIISDPLGAPVVTTLVSSGLTTVADIDTVLIQGTEYLVAATKHAVTGVALPGGQVFTIAGVPGTSGNAYASGDIARFKLVRGVDAANGAIFVMDSQNYQVKQITLDPGGNPMDSASWFVALLAGDGTNAHADGVGNVARFQYSQHLAASPSGKLYAASYSGDSIRLIESQDSILPFLGSGGSGAVTPVRLANPDGYYDDSQETRPYVDYSTAQSPIAASSSRTLEPWTFLIPEGVGAFEFVMAVESSTDQYAALPANMSPGSVPVGSSDVFVRMVAGSNRSGYGDGVGSSAAFGFVYDIETDDIGNIFVADYYGGVRMMSPDGRVSTIIGDNTRFGAPTNTTGDLVSFQYLSGIAVNGDGTIVYIVDNGADMICRANLRYSYLDRTDPANWDVRVIAGTGVPGYANGDGSIAEFNRPWDVAIGTEDTLLYVSDAEHDKIRRLRRTGSDPRIPTNWRVDLHAGSGATSSSDGFADGIGSAARFNVPAGLAVDLNGDLYVADSSNNAVRMISPFGHVTTLSGTGAYGFADAASGSSAQFKAVYDVAADDAGYVYAVDYNSGSVRRIAPISGETKTVAGSNGALFVDGPGDAVKLYDPIGLAILPSGGLICWIVGDSPQETSCGLLFDAFFRYLIYFG